MPETLRICVDVRDLQTAKTGTKTYLEELCKEFNKLDSKDIQFYFADSSIPVYSGKNKVLKLVEHFRYLVWKQLLLPLKARLKNCKIVFCTDNVVPLIKWGYNTVPVFHDAFFFETPQYYGRLWLWLYMKTALPAAKRSAFVITPSEYAKKQLCYFTNIDNNKIIVIHEGPKKMSHSNAKYEVLEQFFLKKGEYLLHVGSMFKRKNIPALIHAFSKIKSSGYPHLKLVLAGSISPASIESDYESIVIAVTKYNLKNDVILTGYLSDEAMGQLYKSALLYVFPSVNEGFGIPVLEAFQYGLPVLVADNTSLPEVGGNAVLKFNPFDVDDIYNTIKLALDSKDLRESIALRGSDRLQQFSWQKAALALVEVFKRSV